ncbi:hypothetical protein CR513_59816, partial [Mucuna pruriens]
MKLPIKLKELSSFSIQCLIGNIRFEKLLCDLGANVNLMPIFICKRLDTSKLKPTTKLEMKEDSQIFIILGNGELSLSIDDVIEFNLAKSIKQPPFEDICRVKHWRKRQQQPTLETFWESA